MVQRGETPEEPARTGFPTRDQRCHELQRSVLFAYVRPRVLEIDGIALKIGSRALDISSRSWSARRTSSSAGTHLARLGQAGHRREALTLAHVRCARRLRG